MSATRFPRSATGFEDIGLVLIPTGDSEHLRGLAELCDRKAELRESRSLDTSLRHPGVGAARRFRRLAAHYRELADSLETSS